MSELAKKRCAACEGDVHALDAVAIGKRLGELAVGWQVEAVKPELTRTFEFKNYYETMAFVNAIAWMAHQQNHHPDLEVSYNRCKVRYSTHFLQGVSDNDFICAAKVDEIFNLP